MDDFTRFTWIFLLKQTWIFLLKQKPDVYLSLQDFCILIRTKFDKVIEKIRTDNASPFLSSTCQNMFKNLGIMHQITCVYTLQQNEVAERKHRHILEILRAIRFQACIFIKYLGHCILPVGYLMNRLSSQVLNTISPYEKLYDKNLV